MAGEIVVGTSGWRYDHWWGPFYPDDLAAEDSLAHYADRLPAVEVNRTFYSLPDTEAVKRWTEQVPEGFRFADKGEVLRGFAGLPPIDHHRPIGR